MSLELATWSLVFLTAVLAVATIIYANETRKMNKSSETTQKLLEEQNNLIGNQNNLLKEQMEISHNQATTLFELSSNLVRLTLAIGNLPFDAQEIRDKKEKALENRKK
jgi:hypothetical protein